MEIQTALQIVQTLAQGIDPHTGEAFPADSPYQHPDTVRALFQAAQALAEPPSHPAQQVRRTAANAGKPWTDEEDEGLAARFDAGQSIADLSAGHGRTRAAIQARLIKLGKLAPSPDLPRFARMNTVPAAPAATGT